jgi:hypothetical protein
MTIMFVYLPSSDQHHDAIQNQSAANGTDTSVMAPSASQHSAQVCGIRSRTINRQRYKYDDHADPREPQPRFAATDIACRNLVINVIEVA